MADAGLPPPSALPPPPSAGVSMPDGTIAPAPPAKAPRRGFWSRIFGKGKDRDKDKDKDQ